MASSSGYAVATVLTALHEVIPEQQAIISTAHSEDTGLINQTQVDQDACVALSEFLLSLDLDTSQIRNSKELITERTSELCINTDYEYEPR